MPVPRRGLTHVLIVIRKKGCEILENVIREYFTDVFREDFFVVALDRTGCYLFTDFPDDTVVGIQLSEFVSSMSLSEKQVCLCVIGRKSRFNYCDFYHLGEYVLKAKQRRKPVLTNKEIDSILECYGVSKVSAAGTYENFSESGIYKALAECRNQYNLPVSDYQLNQLCKAKWESQLHGSEIEAGWDVPPGLLEIAEDWEEAIEAENVKKDFDTFVPPAGPVISVEHRVEHFLSDVFWILVCEVFLSFVNPGLAAVLSVFLILVIIIDASVCGVIRLVKRQGLAGFITIAGKALWNLKWQFLLHILVVVTAFVMYRAAVGYVLGVEKLVNVVRGLSDKLGRLIGG